MNIDFDCCKVISVQRHFILIQPFNQSTYSTPVFLINYSTNQLNQPQLFSNQLSLAIIPHSHRGVGPYGPEAAFRLPTFTLYPLPSTFNPSFTSEDSPDSKNIPGRIFPKPCRPGKRTAPPRQGRILKMRRKRCGIDPATWG